LHKLVIDWAYDSLKHLRLAISLQAYIPECSREHATELTGLDKTVFNQIIGDASDQDFRRAERFVSAEAAAQRKVPVLML